MTAAWMIEATIVALLLSAGAWAAHRACALYRAFPLRWLWAAALAGTLVASAMWLAPKPASNVTARAPTARGEAAAGATVSAAAPAAPLFRLPSISSRADRALAVAWIAASGIFALVLLVSLLQLNREARRWEPVLVGNARAYLSAATGPAAVGVLHPRVVLPHWVLTLDELAQRAIVAHEAEHQRRRDPALLMAGLAMLVLMPWNPGVWLAWRGLCLAVELDCDARVLGGSGDGGGGIDRARYAQILLGAWERRRVRTPWLPSTALTRAPGLAQRVEHLMRPEPRRREMKTLIGSAAAVLLIVAACETPAPQQVAGPPAPSAELSRGVVVPDGAGAGAGAGGMPLIIVDGVQRNAAAAEAAITRQQGGHPALGDSTYAVVADTFVLRKPARVVADTSIYGILATIPPDSIQHIEILKGNAATAKYGTRALHGVIIITTKAAGRDTLHM